MHILIVYGTTEGQTRKIVDFLSDHLRAAGDSVTEVDASDATAAPDPATFDAVIVAASLHTGHYQAAVEHYVRFNHRALNAKFSVFVPVSLAAASDDEEDVRGREECVQQLLHTSGWSPARVYHVAGAFRYTQYDFLKRWAMKYIAWRKGAPTDTSRDYELTDWDALSTFADEFRAEAQRAPAKS